MKCTFAESTLLGLLSRLFRDLVLKSIVGTMGDVENIIPCRTMSPFLVKYANTKCVLIVFHGLFTERSNTCT